MAESILSEDEIAARMPLWCALSDLFLDTQMQRQDYEAIARAAREGGFSVEQVRDIFEHEVFPALAFNLMSVAGEWAGFDPDFVRERILLTLGRPQATRFLTGGLKKQLLAEEWPRMLAVMEGREPDLSDAPVRPDRPILLIGIGVLVVVAGLALVFGWL
jgi:hypothetical protein